MIRRYLLCSLFVLSACLGKAKPINPNEEPKKDQAPMLGEKNEWKDQPL
jgi:hypothetical protein